MEKNLITEAERFLHTRHKDKRRVRFLRILAVAVVFVTIYALILPAITMSTEVECGMVEHVHEESCYQKQLTPPQPQLTCSFQRTGAMVIHAHDSFCYNQQGELICTLEERAAHTHSAECYQEQRTLLCEQIADPGHQHSASCYTYVRVESADTAGVVGYTCGLQEGEGAHQHTDSCYPRERTERLVCTEQEGDDVTDEEGNVIASGHHHDSSCYEIEEKPVYEKLICGQEESEDPAAGHHHIAECWLTGDELCYQYGCHQHESAGHVHTAACGQENIQTDAQGEQWEQVLTCGEEERPAGHVHTDECYEIHQVLTCCKQEVIPHAHEASCYDENGALVCQLPEMAAHQHTAECLTTPEGEPEPVRILICGMEEHEHGDSCYKIGEEEGPVYYCGNEMHIHTAACYFKSGDQRCTLTEHTHTEECLKPKSSTTGAEAGAALNVSLLYGDQQEHSDGVSFYTHNDMPGFIKLEPSNLTADLEDVTVKLAIPKEYVDMDSIVIPSFTTNSSVTKYTINEVTEDDENYYASITFSAYDKTQTLVLPFGLSFKDNVVPDNYKLEVTASVTDAGGTTMSEAPQPNIYKPKYNNWFIDKFVNTNKLDAFKKDGAHVTVTPQTDGGDPYLDDQTYVNFAFIVNSVINGGSNLDGYRDATSVTLTDTLPTYTDKGGKQCIAVFDQDANPDWMLSADETTVSKTYTGENSRDVLLQIYNDTLKLKFPGLKFEQDSDSKYLIANLQNKISLKAEPSNAVEGETWPVANDPLNFVMTTESGTKGKFSKTAQGGTIYDAEYYKSNPYPWRVRLGNEGITPLKHIRIQDREITDENGEVVVAGLDDALKFVSLKSDQNDSSFEVGKKGNFAEIVDKVIAYYTDGTEREIPITPDMVDSGNFNFNIRFDDDGYADKICNGYEIIFEDSFKLEMKQYVSFMAYTVYRDPVNTAIPAGEKKATFANSARSVNEYDGQDGSRVYSYLTATHDYEMLPTTEELKLRKETWYNGANQNNKVGDKYFYYCYLTGSLIPGKEYGDIRVIDLLPDEVEYVRTTNGWGEFENRGVPEIVENYKNSGRTALIFHTDAETLIKRWKDGWNGLLSFEVQIKEGAHSGTITNYAYVVGDNLEPYTGKEGGTEDIYDLNDNGKADDRIAYGSSDAIIVAAASAYAEKFIAPAGSDNWNRRGLSMTAGTQFDYLLKVTNEIDDQTGLVVYDTLPANGDRGVFGKNQRNSEFPVQLREAITPPEGYTAYYTTDQAVYSSSMNAMVDRTDIWKPAEKVTDWSAVTAFKLVAGDGVKLTKDQPFQVRIPARVPDKLDAANLLSNKTYGDQTSGTMAYLEANNNFGFKTNKWTEPKESNTVWARVPFAGFVLKKVDSATGAELEGAEFTLANSESGDVIRTATSGVDGLLEFTGLTKGTYTLTEAKVPEGYLDDKLSLTVTITQNPATMEYTVTFSGGGDLTGAGTNADPLIVKNVKNGYELPATGGAGTTYTMACVPLMATALCVWYKKKSRREGAEDGA